MWFIWRPFDLAAVTSPGYIFNTRENSSKRQKSIKIWGLPLSKPGRGIGGVKRMFHHRRSESTVNWSCGIQQRAEQLCLIYTKPSSAEWLGHHFWDVLLLKADFLHGYEGMAMRSHPAQPGEVAQPLTDGHTSAVGGFWHHKVSHTARTAGVWAASIPQPLSDNQIMILRGNCPWVP